MSEAVLREAQADDLDAVMAIEESEFTGDAWSRGMMAEEIRSRHTRYLVAERDGEVVGYAGLLCPVGAHEGDVQTIAVIASVRRTGLGRRLLRALLDAARERGAREVFLEVRADNPAAQTLYRSEAFEEIGVRPGYYQPDGVDAIVMRLPLAVTQETL
ncbi:ribosomal-protein-alanine N-acetyltransferase [Rathayibacter tritici]|uniref:Ribosomal-protein-alanine N-acetyltransferase n=1 Tax=Rathayibacter tritici TaxID=33888 RepID=A0A160KQF7_9MICO|nr:ribosomal protein S18-alanine N-acetyltransferase [Rathayibacter tritici]AND15780.1 ribosomal-protein-alanine N-acetyltransferase [Rathayibacter tritici]PPF25440.1 ribosomal-protein-alanine N-acetyltransferase [Rathayibacter tritici]PPF63584.1 ribosomal-protein-alanine N-acetyltransferase [Rathayibacter tritici]PPG05699.1 ribosomal-protein-alanine N-acetyltransferase [Rathayibacter tritici]PPI16010.1 ribosomal-protein-alanine N-acetyltransferase [Rathayibacter tritici]